MEIKKDIQKTISSPINNTITEEEFNTVLRIIAPGTGLRKALDGILSSGRGAIIVIENEFLPPILDGGFKVNCKFSYQKLIELSKMDGAMILSKDLKRINQANVLLTPDSKIPTFETGTRHKAAERTATHISGLVIAISERKKEIVLFYKNKRYKIRDTSEIFRRVNESLQVLEKQKDLFEMYLETLDKLELRNYINLGQAIKTIQRGKVLKKISEELQRYLIELGNEGTLLKTRLKELLLGVDKETNLIIKDYTNTNLNRAILTLNKLSYEELLDKENILQALNHANLREIVVVSGWRILSKTSLSEPEVENLVREAKVLEKITSANIDSDFTSISKDRFSLLKVELERLKIGI